MPLVSDGLLFGALNERQKEGVLAQVAVQAAERFKQYIEAIETAFDFRAPKTQFEKMALYRGRSPEEWAAIQGINPKDYEDQMKAWVNMERLNSFMRLHPRQSESAGSPMPVTPGENTYDG